MWGETKWGAVNSFQNPDGWSGKCKGATAGTGLYMRGVVGGVRWVRCALEESVMDISEVCYLLVVKNAMVLDEGLRVGSIMSY